MHALATGDLEYACARIGARYGARPDAAAWRRIETMRDFDAMLDAARSTALRPWTGGLSAGADVHAMERVFRSHWRALVAEVTGWMPERWRPAIAWGAVAVDLPVLDYLRRGEPSPAWLRDDPLYGERSHRAGHVGEPFGDDLAALALNATDANALLVAWRDEWWRRLPRSHDRDAPLLVTLTRLLSRHARAMRSAPPGDASAIVQSLRARIEILYRRAVLEPTVAFAYLALAALDLARFRAEVVRRAVFPDLPPGP